VRAFWLRRVAFWQLTFWAFVNGSVCIAQLDRDAPSQLLTMSGCPNASYGFYKRGLSMVYVAYGSNVTFWLTG